MKFNIKPFVGDSLFLEVNVTLDGDPFALSGSTVFFTLKYDSAQPDSEALVAKQSGDGITISGSTAEIYIPADETEDLPCDTPLVADVQIRDPDNDIYTVATGTITFRQDVTRRTA